MERACFHNLHHHIDNLQKDLQNNVQKWFYSFHLFLTDWFWSLYFLGGSIFDFFKTVLQKISHPTYLVEEFHRRLKIHVQF